jgi:hypothetical protein
MAIKSVVVLLGLLVLVQGQLPDSDSTVGSTDPMTDALSFKFADEDSSGAPADVDSAEANSSVPEGESFWSDNGSPETSTDSFAEAQEAYIPGDGTDVIFNDAAVGGNATTPDDDDEGFDMVEDVDSDSTADQ